MKENLDEGDRLSRSAEELRAYFEEKMKSVPLPADRAESVREALADLAGARRALHERRASLNALEQRVATIQEEIPSNVVPLRRAPVVRRPAFSAINDKRWILRLDCLIESPYVSEIHKMALELHSQSRRYAFLEIRDIDLRVRRSLPDLLSLGAASIFVPDILHLPPHEQAVLRDMMRVDSLQRPLLMVGSTLPFSQLRGEPGVDIDFLNQLSRAYIKLAKPFAEYKSAGLIKYFLDSLSESPS